MKKINVDEIAEGMILAKEVHGRGGNVLLSKGLVLNGFLGRRLKNWDIAFVYIEGEDEGSLQEDKITVPPEEIRKILEEKFGSRINNSIMKQIFAAVYQHKIQGGQ